jgi:hypothetical protein
MTQTTDEMIKSMHQSSLNLVTLVTSHADHDAHQVMGGLTKFERQLSTACAAVQEEMRQGRDAEKIFAEMNKPMAVAMRFGADDLIAVIQRAFDNFTDLEPGDELSPAATADTLVWITVANQTRVAVRLLFQVSNLYGRAPNGKKLTNA